MKELFKNKSYFLLFQGSLVSSIGTTVFGFAAGIYVMTLFPSETYGNLGAFYFALVSATPIITRLLISPLAGAIVDKMNRIRIIYMSDFIGGALFLLSLYILSKYQFSNYELAYMFAIIGGLAGINSAFFGPAVQSSIPDIVGEKLIQPAMGAQTIISSIQGIIGILLGVILYETLGIQIAILVNAISFIFSGISEMFIKVKYKQDTAKKESKIIDDIKVGFNYIKSKDGLLNMMKYSIVMNFAFMPIFGVGIPFLFKTELGKNGYHLAASSIVFSIAMMIAGIYVGGKHIKSVRNRIVSDLPKLVISITVLIVAIFLVSNGLIGYWVFFTLYVLIIICMAYFMNSVNIPLNSALVRGIEPSYRGRVLSVLQSLSGGATPLGMILGGVIIQFTSVSVLGLMCILVTLYPAYGFTKNKKVLAFYNSLDIVNETKLSYE